MPRTHNFTHALDPIQPKSFKTLEVSYEQLTTRQNEKQQTIIWGICKLSSTTRIRCWWVTRPLTYKLSFNSWSLLGQSFPALISDLCENKMESKINIKEFYTHLSCVIKVMQTTRNSRALNRLRQEASIRIVWNLHMYFQIYFQVSPMSRFIKIKF